MKIQWPTFTIGQCFCLGKQFLLNDRSFLYPHPVSREVLGKVFTRSFLCIVIIACVILQDQKQQQQQLLHIDVKWKWWVGVYTPWLYDIDVEAELRSLAPGPNS